MFEILRPMDIEKRSFEIISGILAEEGVVLDPENEPVIKRVIHTTADFEFQKNLRFTPDAVGKARTALKNGATVVTDTMMAAAGISKKSCAALGVSVVCRMSDPDVAKEAVSRGVTRAVVSMERAVAQTPEAIFAIGNAPTALIRLCELIDEGKARPALVVGVPVGFVNVIESKERLARTDVPSIIAMGRKGGSTVASAILNALLYGIFRA